MQSGDTIRILSSEDSFSKSIGPKIAINPCNGANIVLERNSALVYDRDVGSVPVTALRAPGVISSPGLPNGTSFSAPECAGGAAALLALSGHLVSCGSVDRVSRAAPPADQAHRIEVTR